MGEPAFTKAQIKKRFTEPRNSKLSSQLRESSQFTFTEDSGEATFEQ